MPELLYRVENMAQFIELYDDRVHVQMPLALMRVIPLKDIVDIEFRRANFFVSGKLVIKYRENGVNESVYYPFNFMFNDGMLGLMAKMNGLRQAEEQKSDVVIKEVIKVRCPYCGGLMDENAALCPVCGRPQA
ncbi:MAG TPA: zinc ribbon domain-containing protein [Methanocella sp.]|uniref:zinc ribbon domain-containing protein n=1 Tax=Methanocella sp. TaxID=2052833 RepID=UPI002C405F10|nr:zinc ribbon domain-containing protein [Methanocella sp.]HTY90327.1 zinc ribbon domain-containing protein [Methanocella sp.]